MKSFSEIRSKMCPIVRGIKDSYINKRLNVHSRTLAEVIGSPDIGRGSGGGKLIIEVYHRVFVDTYGKRVYTGRDN